MSIVSAIFTCSKLLSLDKTIRLNPSPIPIISFVSLEKLISFPLKLNLLTLSSYLKNSNGTASSVKLFTEKLLLIIAILYLL